MRSRRLFGIMGMSVLLGACGSSSGDTSGSGGRAGSDGTGATAGAGGDGGAAGAGGAGATSGTGGAGGAATGGTGATGGSGASGGAAGMGATGGAGGSGGSSGVGGTGGAGGTGGGTDVEFHLTGTWATQAIITSRAMGFDLPPSAQFYLTEVQQTGTSFTFSTRICGFDLPSVAGVASISIPPETMDVLRSKVVTGSGALSGTTFGSTYSPETQIVVIGADLTNPTTDPLPTVADPTTALDEDGDTNPGVTIDVDAIVCFGRIEQLYIALRTSATLMGTVQSQTEIVGTADAGTDQSILGMSDSCLNLSSTITVEVLPGAPFVQRRIDGQHGSVDLDADQSGSIDCDELNASIAAVFP